jgi:hypothetical protein
MLWRERTGHEEDRRGQKRVLGKEGQERDMGGGREGRGVTWGGEGRGRSWEGGHGGPSKAHVGQSPCSLWRGLGHEDSSL